MRALVTGCAGFIGSHLTESLLADGHEVVGVDCFNDNYGRRQKRRNLEKAMDWTEFEFTPLDLSRGDLLDLVEDCDVVFHLAAEPGVRKSWGQRFEQYSRNNVMATQHLLDAATRWPEKRFVYASSSSVYGQAKEFPTAETAPTKPLSPYGVTKLAAENLCHLYHANYGVATVSLRYFTVFGPRQRPDMAFHIFCRAALEGQPVTVFDDGTQTRDFSFVEDVVSATRAAAVEDVELGSAYNVGGGSPATLRHALDIISELAGGLEVQYTSRERGDVRDTAAETSRARRDLGFSPKTSLEEGLRAEFAWVRELLAAHA
ncbi:MAG TPA: NAD-dependent epimerase/dehydratase family protein [Solirubrobacteraceae bacterium]|jgi:nucleoside-diphosphate-sugar epimerase